MEARIDKVRITPLPKNFTDPMPQVFVTLEESESEQLLFEYYPDEISFKEEELIGLTIKEAVSLKFRKDKHYLNTEVIGAGA